MPLLEGGMTTRRSGLRLFMLRLPPGGGGDLDGITLPIPLPPVLPSKPGDARAFTNPFPTGLLPAPFDKERSEEANMPPALPVLGGLRGAVGDATFLCIDACCGESMLASVNDVLEARDGVTREPP